MPSEGLGSQAMDARHGGQPALTQFQTRRRTESGVGGAVIKKFNPTVTGRLWKREQRACYREVRKKEPCVIPDQKLELSRPIAGPPVACTDASCRRRCRWISDVTQTQSILRARLFLHPSASDMCFRGNTNSSPELIWKVHIIFIPVKLDLIIRTPYGG